MNMNIGLIMHTLACTCRHRGLGLAGEHWSKAASEHKQLPWGKILALNHHYGGDRQSPREDGFNSGVNQSWEWLMLVTTDAGPLSLGTGLLLSHLLIRCVLTPSFVGLGHGLEASISPFLWLKMSFLLSRSPSCMKALLWYPKWQNISRKLGLLESFTVTR